MNSDVAMKNHIEKITRGADRQAGSAEKRLAGRVTKDWFSNMLIHQDRMVLADKLTVEGYNRW